MDFIEQLLETNPTQKQRQIIDAYLLDLFSYLKQLEPELSQVISSQIRQVDEDKRRLQELDREIEERKNKYEAMYKT